MAWGGVLRRLHQSVNPAKAGIQGMGMSFDKLRTNELSVYLPLSASNTDR